ncbi:hypothetical protein R1sor_017233 [Riccia sorocarpa]|uniref:Myb/SANT-like DNA-binding domain-containing protein n=1 Tax=Riccia sorocarpa TaxID=122646 RepID=A0ABD3I7C4_9MARC
MAHERTWTDEENGTLIQAVSEEYLEQLSTPTTLRIWDLIAANLQDSGVQCTPLEAKVQWDSLAWGYLLIADHSDDCGATVYFDMTAEERTWSGLPPNFPKSECISSVMLNVKSGPAVRPFLSMKAALDFMFKVVMSRVIATV